MVMAETASGLCSEFVPIAELRDRYGLPVATLRRKLSRAGVVLYADPLDERVRLIQREDAERLLAPRPVARKAAGSEAGEAAEESAA
jgi:hypothetical protein